MAEINKENSAARLAALKKCAAADRSVARRMLLAKCAAAIPPPDSVQWKILDAIDPQRVGVGTQTYINALQPANLGALAGIAGGAGLIGSAINPDKERSLTSRAVRGAGGLGLLAGGTYLASNDAAREKFTKALLSLIGKARVGVAKNLGV